MRCLSIVIASYNESKSLNELFLRIENQVKKHKIKAQLILVDDGSTDNTETIVSSFNSYIIEKITYIKLRRNSGKSEAISQGIKNAEHDLICTLDADLQDQPEEIINLLKKLDEGYDLVSGYKIKRLDSLFLKTIPSKIFNFLVRKLLNVNLMDINSGLKLYRKEVWDEIDIYGDLHRFIPVLAKNKGFRIVEISVKHTKRKYGKSKYGIDRFLKGLFDLFSVYFMIKYQSRPFHFFGKIALLLISLSSAFLLHLGFLWIQGISIGGRPLLLISIFMLIIGLQILLFGFSSQLQLSLFREKRKDLNLSIQVIKNFQYPQKENLK